MCKDKGSVDESNSSRKRQRQSSNSPPAAILSQFSPPRQQGIPNLHQQVLRSFPWASVAQGNAQVFTNELAPIDTLEESGLPTSKSAPSSKRLESHRGLAKVHSPDVGRSVGMSASQDTTMASNHDGDSTSYQQNLHRVNQLSRETNELCLKQQKSVAELEDLQKRVAEDQKSYGELLRQSLLIQRRLRERQEELEKNKQDLRLQQAAVKELGEQLREKIALIQELSSVQGLKQED